MKFKLKIRSASDIHSLLEAAAGVRKVTKSRAGFRKALLAALDEKHGEFRLWRALARLADFADELRWMPVEVEAVVPGAVGGAGPEGDAG